MNGVGERADLGGDAAPIRGGGDEGTIPREAFTAHSRQYALIGGTACELLLGQVGLP